MISRRFILKTGTAAGLIATAPGLLLRSAFAQAAPAFDYYISPTGDDNNAGTLASPWSITALNSRRSTYAGKRVGIIGDKGVIAYGRAGGVAKTLYSLYQATTVDGTTLQLEGGTSASSPTYLAACDSAGVYTPRLAVIDAADPVTGALPTTAASLLGQNAYRPVGISRYGNVTIDGLVIRNFTFGAVMFQATPAAPAPNVIIQNCEISNGQNVVSNNNPGAVWIRFATGAIVKNCLIHDLRTSAGGAAYPWQFAGLMTFDCVDTILTKCTFYNCISFHQKDGWQSTNVSYCYMGFGTFGSAYTMDTPGMGYAILNYITDVGKTIAFHHNIVLGPMMAFGGATGDYNKGRVKIYNNTFYQPRYGGTNRMGVIDNPRGNSGGSWDFYNNLVYSEVGYDYGGHYAGGVTMYGADLVSTILGQCDKNAYGTGMTFATDYVTKLGLTLSAWRLLGHDLGSTTLSGSPFVQTPSEAVPSSFAITGPATAAGVGGAVCGAMDSSGTVGCDFGPSALHSPKAPGLIVT
jgi:hypothetical protein